MKAPLRHWIFLGAVWLAVTAAGSALVVQTELEHERVEFVLEAQGLHRLMSQQMRQHEQLTAALALAQSAATAPSDPIAPPPLLGLRHDANSPWPASYRSDFERAEARSVRTGRAEPAGLDLTAGHYWLVRRQGQVGVAVQYGLQLAPMKGATEPFAGRGDVWARLEHDGQRLPLIRASATLSDEVGGWRFGFRQRLAQDDLGMDLVAVRRLGWAALPWRELVSWALLTSLLALGAGALLLRSRRAVNTDPGREASVAGSQFLDFDRPSPADVRSGQRSWGLTERAGSDLEPLGSGIRPSTPLMMTLRELDIEPPELTVARGAISQASRQARRTSAVIDGLRRKLEEGDSADTHIQPVALDDLLSDAVDLLRPGCDSLGVECRVRMDAEPCDVMADPMVLEQLLHRLFGQALRALQAEPAGRRQLHVALVREADHALISISNSASAESQRVLDDSASRKLAQSIGVTLSTRQSPQLGCEQRLCLPLSA